MKSKNSLGLTQSNDNLQSKTLDNLRDVAEATSSIMGQAIQKGVENPIASTGTPISELNGMAKDLAIFKNIAKELKEDGKVNDALNAIRLKDKADTVTQTLDFVQKSKEEELTTLYLVDLNNEPNKELIISKTKN